jgi:hypothetical protein
MAPSSQDEPGKQTVRFLCLHFDPENRGSMLLRMSVSFYQKAWQHIHKADVST